MKDTSKKLLIATLMCVSSVGVAQTSTLQNTTATSAAVEPCKQTAPPAAVQREEQKAGGKLALWLNKKIKTASGGKLDGSDLGNVADGLKPQPKPCVPRLPEKPVIKELCPPNTSRVEGTAYCSDGNKLLDVVRIPVVGSSTAAPANIAPGQPAR
jgi:hypothetical protein